MLNANRLLQGLAFGVVGCAFIPLTKSSSTAGGGTSIEKVSSLTHSQQPSHTKERDIPKPVKVANLLLAGTNSQDGVVAELFQYEGEEGQWKVNKVTWRGNKWNSNWILYSDKSDGEYTFTDKSPFENRTGCWGYARYWGRNKVCVAHGRVKQEHQEKWKRDFPKIRFDGWSARLRGGGYSLSSTLDKLIKCTVSINKNKTPQDANWTVTISCQNGWLVKTLSDSDIEKAKV